MTEPGRRPAHQERSRNTQRKILTAARQALIDGNWEGVAVARVAAEAGVAVGSVYQRFVDKEGLIHAVQHDVLDEVDADLRAAFTQLRADTAGPPAELIAGAVRALAEQVTRHGAVMRPLMLRAAVDPSLRERGNTTSSLAEHLFTSLLFRSAELGRPSMATAVPMAFRVTFSAAMWQVMFGPDSGLQYEFTEERLLLELITLCQSYLLGSDDGDVTGGEEG